MITNFEDQTHELTPYEREELLPVIAKALSTKIGKAKAVTNKVMVDGLYTNRGLKTTGPRMRKIIHEIRITGAVPRLMATSKGYYVSNDKNELLTYANSLHQRANSILSIAKQIEFQIRTL